MAHGRALRARPFTNRCNAFHRFHDQVGHRRNRPNDSSSSTTREFDDLPVAGDRPLFHRSRRSSLTGLRRTVLRPVSARPKQVLLSPGSAPDVRIASARESRDRRIESCRANRLLPERSLRGCSCRTEHREAPRYSSFQDPLRPLLNSRPRSSNETHSTTIVGLPGTQCIRSKGFDGMVEMAVALAQRERHHCGGVRGFAGRQRFVHDNDTTLRLGRGFNGVVRWSPMKRFSACLACRGVRPVCRPARVSGSCHTLETRFAHLRVGPSASVSMREPSTFPSTRRAPRSATPIPFAHRHRSGPPLRRRKTRPPGRRPSRARPRLAASARPASPPR